MQRSRSVSAPPGKTCTASVVIPCCGIGIPSAGEMVKAWRAAVTAHRPTHLRRGSKNASLGLTARNHAWDSELWASLWHCPQWRYNQTDNAALGPGALHARPMSRAVEFLVSCKLGPRLLKTLLVCLCGSPASVVHLLSSAQTQMPPEGLGTHCVSVKLDGHWHLSRT